MLKGKMPASLIAAIMALVGLGAGVATMANAQSSAISTNSSTAVTSPGSAVSKSVDTPESPNDPADTDTGSKAHGQHAPLGGDGVVSSITGSTIVIGEESNEGGASYTVDASKATVTNKGVAASLTDIKVGDKIFVQGAVNGTNVSATSVSIGNPGHKGANDTDGSSANEASEKTSSSDTSDQ